MSPAGTLVQTPETETTCPQCGSTESWGGNSWCPSCGFYPKFAGDGAVQMNPIPQTEVTEEADEGFPQWAWVLIGGIALILTASLAFRFFVHFNGGQRAWVALFMMIVGFTCCGVTSTIALIRQRKSDRTISLFDAICNPAGVWRPILQDMPETRKLVWFGSWGMTLVLAANVCVGGIKYSGLYTNDWGFEMPEEEKGSLLGTIAQAASGGAGAASSTDLLEQLDQFQAAQQAGLPAEPPTVNCVVYGYLADEFSPIGRLLIARRVGGKLKHCAVIKSSDLDEETHDVLLRMTREQRTGHSQVSSSLNARWVKPNIELKMTFEGFAGGGELVKPAFHSLDVLEKSKAKALGTGDAGSGGSGDLPGGGFGEGLDF